MKKYLLMMVALFAAGPLLAADAPQGTPPTKDISAPKDAPATGKNPTTAFLATNFTLAYVEAKAEGTLNEYVVKGETVDSWMQLLTVTYFPKNENLEQFAKAIVQSSQPILASEPQLVTRPGVAKEDDLALFLVLLDSQHGVYEVDIQRFVREPGLKGLKFYQYGRRYFSKSTLPTPDEINRWLTAIWDLKVPVYDQLPAGDSPPATGLPAATSATTPTTATASATTQPAATTKK